MREIKFRVWNNHLKEMYLINKEKYFGSTAYLDCSIKNGEAIWMQYTGLKDKSEKDIYEGDIIRRDTGYVFEIKIREYLLGAINQAVAFGYDWCDTDEIIGNIYENPELLQSQ